MIGEMRSNELELTREPGRRKEPRVRKARTGKALFVAYGGTSWLFSDGEP